MFFFFCSVRLTVASMAPICLALICAKAPAMKIPYHQEDILLLAAPTEELVNSLFELQSPCDGNCVAGRDEESNGDRYFIKVINKNGSNQVEAKNTSNGLSAHQLP